MEEWKEYKLEEVTSILGDGIHGTPKYDDEGSIFFINGNNLENGKIVIKENTKRVSSEEAIKHSRPLSNRTILVPINGTLGNVAKYNGESCILGKSACYFNVNEDVDLDFIYYVVANNQFKDTITRLATGTTIKNVSLKTMREYSFWMPSKETQKRVSAILKSLDDKIEVNRRINEQLEELAGALFKSWFVDFEPFKDGEFVDSELGMIPKGWKVGTLGEYCKVKSGFAFKSSWWQDNGLKVIKIKNITSDGVLDMNDCSYVSSENTLKAKDFKTNVGDLLIAMTGATIGKFCIISSREEMYVNQRVGKFFLGDNPIIKLPFIYCTLKTERVYSEIVNKGQGSAQPNISGSDIENIHIPIPLNIDLLSLFNGKLKSIFEKMIHNQQEIHHLITLRDTLLPKLMSGEIDVNEVEI